MICICLFVCVLGVLCLFLYSRPRPRDHTSDGHDHSTDVGHDTDVDCVCISDVSDEDTEINGDGVPSVCDVSNTATTSRGNVETHKSTILRLCDVTHTPKPTSVLGMVTTKMLDLATTTIPESKCSTLLPHGVTWNDHAGDDLTTTHTRNRLRYESGGDGVESEHHRHHHVTNKPRSHNTPTR